MADQDRLDGLIERCLACGQWRIERTSEEIVPDAGIRATVTSFALRYRHRCKSGRRTYCQSGINSLGRIVEVVSGQPFDAFLRERIFDPLGMKDTTFYPTPEQIVRMVKPYKVVDGKKTETVKQMATVHSGDLKTGFTPGNGWGLGVCVIREPQGVTATLSPGSFGHGGAFGTQGWIDPVKRCVTVLVVQRTNFGNGDASAVRGAFQAAAAQQE